MRIKFLARIRAKLRIDVATGCIVWTGTTNDDGYGRVWVGGKMLMVHRVVYEALEGPIPDGMVLDHLCRNRPCASPAHLEPVDSRTNTLRGVGVTAKHAAKTHCPRGHEYTPENTYSYKRGGRQCRTCVIARSAARRRAA